MFSLSMNRHELCNNLFLNWLTSRQPLLILPPKCQLQSEASEWVNIRSYSSSFILLHSKRASFLRRWNITSLLVISISKVKCMHNKFFFHAYTTDTIFQFFSVTNMQQYFTKKHSPPPPQKKDLREFLYLGIWTCAIYMK